MDTGGGGIEAGGGGKIGRSIGDDTCGRVSTLGRCLKGYLCL